MGLGLPVNGGHCNTTDCWQTTGKLREINIGDSDDNHLDVHAKSCGAGDASIITRNFTKNFLRQLVHWFLHTTFVYVQQTVGHRCAAHATLS